LSPNKAERWASTVLFNQQPEISSLSERNHFITDERKHDFDGIIWHVAENRFKPPERAVKERNRRILDWEIVDGTLLNKLLLYALLELYRNVDFSVTITKIGMEEKNLLKFKNRINDIPFNNVMQCW